MINVKPLKYHMSVGTTFLAILRSVKIQIGILAVWSGSSQGSLWAAKNPKHLQTDSEDSNPLDAHADLSLLGAHAIL